MNIYFKKPDADYQKMFDRMQASGEIYTFGLKKNANKFGELVFDVNTSYFYHHGGYEFAKKFYADVYQAAIKIVGGEQYILSAVVHADEINRGLTEELGEDIYHYHMHVVYIPVVEKQILWPETCEDEKLRGTVKETVMQVSCSRKWAGRPAMDENGEQLYTAAGKKVYINSYTLLQDYYFRAMQEAGYTDIERGEPGSSEVHLTVAQFKVEKEKEKLASVSRQVEQQEQTVDKLSGKIRDVKKKKASIEKIEAIDARPIPLSSKVILTREEYEQLSIGAQKYAAMEKQEGMLRKQLTEANRNQDGLREKIADLTAELSEYKSVARNLNEGKQKVQIASLKRKLDFYEQIIGRNHLERIFSREKASETRKDSEIKEVK